MRSSRDAVHGSRTRKARMAVESLERRLPLAGDVSIFTGGGGLRILSGELDQDLSIEQMSAGEFRIVGNDGETFRVNGADPVEGPVSVSGITKGLLVSVGDGNDVVSISGLSSTDTLASMVTLLTGRGSDSATIESARINGPLTIDTGLRDTSVDADSVVLTNLSVSKSLVINTGRGDDAVEIDGVSATVASVTMGDGADSVDIAASAAVAFDSLVLMLGAGDDAVEIGSGTLALRQRRSVFAGGNGSDSLQGQSNLTEGSLGRLVWTGFEVVGS